MARHTAVCLTIALLITCAQYLDAARVSSLTPATKEPFVCPPPCQECCDQTVFTNNRTSTSSAFKCILVSSYGSKGTPVKKKEYQQTMKDTLAQEGYKTCSTPQRRSKSLFQFKTSCSYKDNQEKALGSCSKKTMCCCNEKQDAEEHKCIKPLEQQWFEWNRAFQHNATRTVEPQTVVDAVAGRKVVAGDYYMIMEEKEWRANHVRGQLVQHRHEGEGEALTPLCDEDMMYVEFVGQRKGACLGDQSTGASLAHFYGATLYTSAAEWEAVAGRASVTAETCPAGWFGAQGRGGVRSCHCDMGCGGAGAFLNW